MTEPALQRLSRGPFVPLLRSRAVAIEPDAVTVLPTYLASADHAPSRVEAGLVVLVSHNRANRELAAELEPHGIPLQVVGDANSPRFLQAAIREGRMAGIAV